MGRGRKIYKRVENTNIKELSKEQEEVMYYLIDEFLTIPKIASIRNTSTKAVYKTIKKLKDKGFIKGVEKNTLVKGGGYKVTPKSNNKNYRLHAQSFTINILDLKDYYLKLLKKRNRDELDNNSIILYKDKIVIYYNKDFWGESVNDCIRLSLSYTDRFITMLENNYKIVLKTNTKCDIKEFRGEISKINDPYAREININKEKIRVYDEEGTLRLIVDNSYNYDELEAVSKNYRQDMKSIEAKWLDLLKTDFKLSEAENHIKSLQVVDKVMASKIEYIVEIIGNMSILQNNTMEQLREVIERIKER